VVVVSYMSILFVFHEGILLKNKVLYYFTLTLSLRDNYNKQVTL